MAIIRPKILVKRSRQGSPVKVPIYDLIVDSVADTYLTSDLASGTTALAVKNTAGFNATSQVLGVTGSTVVLIGQAGNEGSEIRKVASVTSPSTITAGSTTSFPHSANTPIILIPYDQVEFSSAASLTGAKTSLDTLDVRADSEYTSWDLQTTAAYFFARFKHSNSGTFSPYSDGVPGAGYTQNMARSIIDNALLMIGKKTSEALSDEYGFLEINNCQMEVLRELKRWSWMQQSDYSMGTTVAGAWSVRGPSDLDDTNTNKAIYNFRLGTKGNLKWIDKQKWNEMTEGVANTTVSTAFAAGDSSIILTNSNDFDTSGNVLIGVTSIPYTANNKNTNTLTVDGTTPVAGVANQAAFQGGTTGEPRYWTIFGGDIYTYPIYGTTVASLRQFLDYYKSLTSITSDTDTIVIPDPTVVQYYLAWKFLLKINRGTESSESQTHYNNYVVRRERLKQKETLGTSFVLKPRFNDFSRQMGSLNDNSARRQRLGGFDDI